jgi:hypothetical protein
MADMIVITAVSTVGIPDIKGMPLSLTLTVIAYSLVFSLVVNDLVKWVLVRRTGLER